MPEQLIVVEGLRATRRDHTDLRRTKEAWSFALDQRAFGPGRLLAAVATPNGRFRGIAHCVRTDPPEDALDVCLRYARDHFVRRGPAAVIAYQDEPVSEGPPAADTAERFDQASAVARSHGMHLVDWFACDDQLYRSFRLALHPGEPWWPVDRLPPPA